MEVLKDSEGYLNIGRETAEGTRDVYFACDEFRKASVAMRKVCEKYKDSIQIDYDIFKDKYWRCLNHLMN